MTVSPERYKNISLIQERASESLSKFDYQEKFALLDFPDHDNIGDSAIYSGESKFINARGVRPSYCSTTSNFSQDAMESAIGDGPILMHGGGNFGTIWKSFQDFREKIIKENPNRNIIQLPQTIYFDSQKEIDNTARIIDKHKNYTILVRDQKSFDVAFDNFQCDVKMCPDMAFFIGPVQRRPAEQDFLLHLREDQEAAGNYETAEIEKTHDAIRLDWPREGRNFKRDAIGKMMPGLFFAGLRGGRQGFRERRYRGLADYRLRRGIELLSRGEKVITNRLHGHILCYLMDIPHCVIDNSYGKTSSFMDAWGTGGGNVHRADTVEEAIALLS